MPTFLLLNDWIEDDNEDEVEIDKVGLLRSEGIGAFSPAVLLFLLLLSVSVTWFLLLLLPLLLFREESRGGGVRGGTRGRAVADDDDGVGGDSNRSRCGFIGLLKGLETMACCWGSLLLLLLLVLGTVVLLACLSFGWC